MTGASRLSEGVSYGVGVTERAGVIRGCGILEIPGSIMVPPHFVLSRGGRPLGRRRRLLERILSGRSDANIPFEQTRTLLKSLGFEERIVGSHHIFARRDIPRRPDLQPTREAKLKPYQVKQLRELLVEYGLDKE